MNLKNLNKTKICKILICQFSQKFLINNFSKLKICKKFTIKFRFTILRKININNKKKMILKNLRINFLKICNSLKIFYKKIQLQIFQSMILKFLQKLLKI